MCPYSKIKRECKNKNPSQGTDVKKTSNRGGSKECNPIKGKHPFILYTYSFQIDFQRLVSANIMDRNQDPQKEKKIMYLYSSKGYILHNKTRSNRSYPQLLLTLIQLSPSMFLFNPTHP